MVLTNITSFYMYLRSIVIQGLKYQPGAGCIKLLITFLITILLLNSD
jgi:hypothetical protein